MLREKGFIPYISIIFFNSFVDLGHKILIQNTIYQTETANHFSLLSSIINAFILLPYLLLFTPSGFIADKFSKTKVLRFTALAAIPLTLMVTWSYYHGYFTVAFTLTLLLATQSAINSPAKYGYIKEIFGKANIAKANAIVQTTTIVAILASTFVFSIIFNHYLSLHLLQQSTSKSAILHAFAPAGFILVILSVAESIFTFLIPKKSAADPHSHYQVKQYIQGIYLRRYLKEMTISPILFICILGLAVFWGVNQVLLASYGAYLKTYTGNPSTVYVQGALAVGGIGILLGATYAGRISRGFIETGIIPIAAIGITLGLFCLPNITNHITILFLFFFYGMFGGMLIVPLNALIQFNAKDRNLGKVMAANNFVQTVFMLGFLAANIIYTSTLGNIRHFLFALFGVALISTIFAIIRLPQAMLRYLVYFIVSKFYRIDAYGLDNLPSTGGVLLLGNHTSFLDWALLQITSPRPIRFVMERSIYEKWYLKWFLSRLNMIPISSGGSKQAISAIHQALQDGEVVALFPEGCLSRNGQIGKFHNGFEKSLKDSQAVVIPFYLHGLWGTASSYATSRYKTLAKIRHQSISVSFGKALPDTTTSVIVKQQITQLSIIAWKRYVETLGTIPEEWLRRVKQHPKTPLMTDSLGIHLNNTQLLSTVMAMKQKFHKHLTQQHNIGILLPPGAGGIIANLSVLCMGKTVVNLNYTSTLQALLHALEQAEIKTIITAKKFIKKLAIKGFPMDSLFKQIQIIYLEDFKTPTTKLSILRNFIVARLTPLWILKKIVLKNQNKQKTAAILFSSGSEGKPKGVELTHQNILGNAKQISSIFNIQENDVVLSTLPLFHAFGLTATTIMPLIEATPMVCHADPTDAVNIGKLVCQHHVTVMCGTSTFFRLYCRNKRLLPQMFSSLRLVIAGAEKLSDQVRNEFKKKFNLNIFEGYGATEVAPVASSNLPDILDTRSWHLHMANKTGSVGLPLPGTAFKVVDPNTLCELPTGEAGMVLIGGIQVMKGYLKDIEKTKAVLINDAEITWYITGDKGYLDEDGYLTIVDRYSRFAKIGGEMISLTQVEKYITTALNDSSNEIMAITLPDIKKGEKIVLLHTQPVNKAILRDRLIKETGNNILLPTVFILVKALPKLGSGKKDYVAAKQMAFTSMEAKQYA